MIAEGRIALNGTVIDTPATLLSSLDGVTVDGDPVAAPEPTRLFLFNKPTGLLVTERDPMGRPTIYDRLPAGLPRLVPVGRLDVNTEGLLLLTTDGGFKRQLELPATGVERTYRARAYGEVSQAQLEELIHGIEIDGIRYGQIDANLERRTGANVWIEMTLREGKNREVRRVLEHLGLQVSRLIRLRYGPFVLEDLPVGEIGEVKGSAIVEFRRTLEGGIPSDAVRPTPRAGFRAPPTRTAPPRARPDRDDGERRDRTPRPASAPGEHPVRAAGTPSSRDSRFAPSERRGERPTGRPASGDRGKPFVSRGAGVREERGERRARGAGSPSARQDRFTPQDRGGERGKPFANRASDDRPQRGERPARGKGSPSSRQDRFTPNERGGERPAGRPAGGERSKPFAKRTTDQRTERGDRPDRGGASPSARPGRPARDGRNNNRPTGGPGGRPRGGR